MTALDGLTRTISLSRDYVSDHLTDDEICQNLQSLRVLCVSDLQNLSSYSGQTALVTLVSLLGRMGMQVGLCIPEVEMVGPQPPLTMGPLRAILLTLSENVIAGAFVRHNLGFQPDIVFVLGDTKFDSQQLFWRLSGDDWAGSLKMGETRTESHAWRSTWTGGSMISAALAANEAVKFAVRRMELRDPKGQIFFGLATAVRLLRKCIGQEYGRERQHFFGLRLFAWTSRTQRCGCQSHLRQIVRSAAERHWPR